MKTRFLSLFLTVLLCLGLAASVWSFGGSQADPAVSLSYLRDVWGLSLTQEAETAIHLTAQKEKQTQMLLLANSAAAARQSREKSHTATRFSLGQVLLKKGDTLLLKAGAKILPLDGKLEGGDGLINITQGAVHADSALITGQTYMQKQDAKTALTVVSATAELWMDGSYVLRSADGVDYGSLAQGLADMGLFRGMTGGFMLEGGTTRAQGLVMFLRLLGLEEAALQSKNTIPFTDVPETHWAYPYVAYAYGEGLTGGTSDTAFSPNAPITAQQYLTFLFRALHYEEGKTFSYNTVLNDAVQHGLFTETEVAALSQGELLRYKMVYLSYYGLFAIDLQEGKMLMDRLIANGTLTEELLATGLAAVKSVRMA